MDEKIWHYLWCRISQNSIRLFMCLPKIRELIPFKLLRSRYWQLDVDLYHGWYWMHFGPEFVEITFLLLMYLSCALFVDWILRTRKNENIFQTHTWRRRLPLLNDQNYLCNNRELANEIESKNIGKVFWWDEVLFLYIVLL